MKHRYILALFAGFCSTAALAAPGQWWEINSKMEMAGMPFPMPATSTRVCIGNANDPQQSMQDKDCKMSDIKTSGNTTTWKVRCVHDGEVMNGTGEMSSTPDSYQGKMRMTGKSGGEKVDMATSYRGKRVGPACDTAQPSPEMAAAQKQMDQSVKQTCETKGRSTPDLVGMADIFLRKDGMCGNKSKSVCETISRDAGKDADTFTALLNHDQNLPSGGIHVAKACGIDMAASTRAVCKTLNGKNYQKLSAHCPAEAKAYREAQRKKECEGRSYTAATRSRDLAACLAGTGGGRSYTATGKTDAGANNPAGAVIDGAKKLKGLFGF